MTSYSRIFYEVYDPATKRALAAPVDYATARAYADESGGAIRFVRAERLTRSKARPDFFDDEISRAIRTTEVVPALHNEVAEEGCDRCFCGCKYWEHDRCIDCGTHVSTIREESRRDELPRDNP